MGLVGYSDSEGSDSEGPAPPPPKPNASKPATTTKPAFTKLVDRQSNKIKVQLPGTAVASVTVTDGERPTKRAKTASGSGGGFNAMLPAPKRTGAIRGPAANTGGVGGAKKGLGKGLGVGVNLKTSAAAAFSRERVEPDPDFFDRDDFGAPVVPSERKDSEISRPREEEKEVEADTSFTVTNEAQTVTKVAKPMMFKPLSVMQREKAKKKKKLGPQATVTGSAQAQLPAAQSKAQQPASVPDKPKVSLFSISSEETASRAPSTTPYEPILERIEPEGEAHGSLEHAFHEEQQLYAHQVAAPAVSITAPDLSSIAADLNLTPAERRRLFGRNAFKDPSSAALPAGMSIKSYNAEAQYAENEAIRASGEEIAKAPVRAIAGGKHSLKQLISNATTQKDALEESFARGRDNKREAGAKYGF